MATRPAQWHAGYNPVTHTGDGGPAQEKPKGVKITAKVVVSNLTGGACIPLESAAGAFTAPPVGKTKVASPTAQQLSPARIDHLVGGACAPSSSEPQPGSPGLHGSGRASPKVNLRAAVDHLAGVACAVQQVEEVATADAPLPQVQRGMATKLTKDRMFAQQAREHMNSSCLYSLGAGYTPVVTLSSSTSSGSPQEAS